MSIAVIPSSSGFVSSTTATWQFGPIDNKEEIMGTDWIAAIAKMKGYVDTYLAIANPTAAQKAALRIDLKTLDRNIAGFVDAHTPSVDTTAGSGADIFDPAAKADALANQDDVATAAAAIAAVFGESPAAVVKLINGGKFPFWRLPLANPAPVSKGALVGWLQGRGAADATAIEWSNRYPNATIAQLQAALSPVPGASGQNPYGIYVDEAGFEAHMAQVLS